MIGKFAARFAHDQSGLSALEFALIAPLMITTYFGAYEMCDVLLMDRKVTNVAAATTISSHKRRRSRTATSKTFSMRQRRS